MSILSKAVDRLTNFFRFDHKVTLRFAVDRYNAPYVVPLIEKLIADGEDGDTYRSALAAWNRADGRVDFVRQDDRFRYRFSSGAGSLSPPVIYNISQGQLVDVSKKPEFAAVWAKFAAEARALCTDTSQSDRNGACAAYVAAAARLGNFEPAMREAKRFAAKGKKLDLPVACRSAVVDGQCPVGMERKFLTFGDALRWFLQDIGYTG